MISRYLQNLWLELNDFLSNTTIHGLPYIHQTQTRATRLIWTVLVAAALTTATVFLVETVGDWDTKYISTTVETRGVQTFPFPAVTFHPGEFPLKKHFLRTFLNHFELARYEESSPLFENSVFMKKYSNLVNHFGPSAKSLFDWVPDYLLSTEKRFIKQKNKIFRNEVCAMLSLKNKNIRKYKETKKEIIKQFDENMFKYSRYSDILGFSRGTFNSLIKDAVVSENISSIETETACKEKQNGDEKKEIEALLLSFLFVFIDPDNLKSLGPGDIAAEDYFHLSPSLKAEMTRLFNDLTNANFALSVFLLPDWFSLAKQIANYHPSSDALPSTISKFELQRYQEFWAEYNDRKEKITFICSPIVRPCKEGQGFVLDRTGQESKLNAQNTVVRVRQADLLSAPCQNVSLAQQFNFRKSV